MNKKSILLSMLLMLLGIVGLKAQQTYSYDFDNNTSQGWTYIDADGDGNNWIVYEESEFHWAHSGQYYMASASFWDGYAVTPDNYLVSPIKCNYRKIHFYARCEDEDFSGEHFGIAVSTSGNTNANDFTTIAEWTLTAKGGNGTWAEYTVNFDDYIGEPIWVAFRHFNCTDMMRICIDDVALSANTIIMPQATAIDFENGTMPSYIYNDADYPWVITDADNGSAKCIKSGNSGVAKSSSECMIVCNFPQDGFIYFDFWARGEGNSNTICDACIFYIDGVEAFSYGERNSWDQYSSSVEAGIHRFTWKYKKDSWVNPKGDAFFVDNIHVMTGDLCVTPSHLTVTPVSYNSVKLKWDGASESFTLRYKLASDSQWTTIGNITERTYLLTGLATGNYEAEVMADCEGTTWISATFEIENVNFASTANWYGYMTARSSFNHRFISFKMQNMGQVNEANENIVPETWAAAYADGYVWFITESDKGRNLCKAPLDNHNKTIGDYEIVIEAFEQGGAHEMSYNPVDGKMYYLDNGDASVQLKCFNLSSPANVTTIGSYSQTFLAFAINASGQAYGIQANGDLYQINLSNAAAYLVGSTGVNCEYVQSMSFDLATNELFWAQVSETDYHIYKVDCNTAAVTMIGKPAGEDAEITGLFAVPDNTGINENNIATLSSYPNPAKEVVYIDGVEGMTISVYDATGRFVMSETYNGSLNVSGLKPGIYAITTEHSMVKFVKE